MRRALPLACALAGLALATQCAGAAPLTAGAQAAAGIRTGIEHGECELARASLANGLAAQYPEVQLLEGSMYEGGMCVEPDWNRALQFYSQAFTNGQRQAAYRLAAGFAAPVNGPDAASSLWWGSRVNVIARGCLPSVPARGNEDLFRAELKTWPAQRLATCAYLTGVMAAIMVEVRYPAREWPVGGDVVITFKPAVPRLELTLAGNEHYVLANGGTPREPGKGKADTFVEAMRTVAEHAITRYPRPEGIPADIPDMKSAVRFTVEDARMPQFRD
jgi:TPR repeat protein